MDKPKLIKGGLAVDDRGSLRFVNDFDFSGVKRFYQVENHSNKVIRAFHGHMHEEKYVYVVDGSALVLLVPLDKTENPSKDVEVQRFVLTASSPSILYIPAGYANGFKFLSKDSKVLFFSTKSLSDSEQNDDYRYNYDYWGKDIWEVENR
jgi:dTDP-4-dehydrorhamnose 3,5-epimerase